MLASPYIDKQVKNAGSAIPRTNICCAGKAGFDLEVRDVRRLETPGSGVVRRMVAIASGCVGDVYSFRRGLPARG